MLRKKRKFCADLREFANAAHGDCDDDHQIVKSQLRNNVAESCHCYFEMGFCPYLSIPRRRIFDSKV